MEEAVPVERLGDRVTNIKKQAKERGCKGTATNRAEYQRIKQRL